MDKKPWRIIHHTYAFVPSDRPTIDWDAIASSLVSYDAGYQGLVADTTRIVDLLHAEPNSRQAVQMLNDGKYMSCLLGIQWLLGDDKLWCNAFFRSQHYSLGRPGDTAMLEHLYTLVLNGLNKHGRIIKAQISVTVGDYHNY